MKNNKDDCQAQLREIISERLKQDSPLTWHDIVTALRFPSVNHPDVARHIESWYKSPALDFQEHSAFEYQQYLSLGGERPHAMLMMGLSTRKNPNRDIITCNSCGACFRAMPVFLCMLCQREPSHGENYQPHTQMMDQTSVVMALHSENYQPPTQMKDQTPVTGVPHEENCQPLAMLREPVDIRHPQSNTLSTTQPYPTTHAQGSSATAHHRSPMDTFVPYVKSTYKISEIEKNLNVLKWPPTPSKMFINLACIDSESVVSKEEADKYMKAMVEDGNVDVILKEKKNIDFKDIVQVLPLVTASEKVVLVEGAPGVGKSTFAWEFCRRWERGEIAQQYQLVLLLRLRDERMSRAKSLKDLIYHPSESVCQAVVDELEFTFGVNTLIILEGFDELPDSQQKESSIFLQLILGHLLLHASIMIVSRPWATGALLAQFKHRIFLHIEILGFTEENILKYITSVFTEGRKTASATDQSVGGPDEVKKNIDDIMAYIGKYPQIKACMYIPLNAAIVVSIHQESKKGMCILPKTLTELYYALTQTILLHYLHGHTDYKEQQLYIDSFEKDLPKKVYKQLLTICKVAYDGVCREGRTSVQLIFSDRDLGGCETLDFMQSVNEMYTMYGQKTSHNFLHLTFQEFLAAFLISTMSSAQQLKHFQRHEDGRLRVVLGFLAGLTKLNKVTLDELRSLLGEPTVEESDEDQTPYCNPMRPDVCVSTHHTNWLFEAQNSELLQSLFNNRTASFTFTRGMLPFEHYCVNYCIAHSHSKWLLTLDEEKKLHMLVSGAKTGDGDYRIALKTMSENRHILINGFSYGLEKFLYYLIIPDNGEIHIDIVANGLGDNIIPALRSLDNECKCIFTTTAARSLAQIVTRNTTLQYIRICHVTFSAQGLIELTEAIHHRSRLQEKHFGELSFYLECSEDVVNLRHMIKDHPDMQKSITNWDGVTNSSIQLDDKTKASLLSFGLGCSQDTALYLPGIINDVGAKALALALHHNYTLKKLYLSNNDINDGGATALAETLHHNSNLEWLYLSNNCISDTGAEDLAEALHHNSTLERLYLNGNDAIGKVGTYKLVQALTVNTSITRNYPLYGGLGLPKRCEVYATHCKQYTTVEDRMHFL